MTDDRRQTFELRVNDCTYRLELNPLKRLLDVLREDLHLTGTKEGCGEGECGACTVICEDRLLLSCLTPVCQVKGKPIRTIEGLARGDSLHPVQQAFLETGGTQCGICTPGMILAACYYLEHPELGLDPREALAGNQCRCTGYTGVLEAVQRAIELLQERS